MAVNGKEYEEQDLSNDEMNVLADFLDGTVTPEDVQETVETNEDSLVDLLKDEHKEEIKQEKKRSRAQERIQQLLEEKKHLEEQLKLKDESLNKNTRQTKISETKEDIINLKQTIMQKLVSKDINDVYDAIDTLATTKAKNLVKETLSEVMPIIQDVAIDKKARQDGIESRELQKVFEEYPELLNLPNGYDIAKKMLRSNSSSTRSASVGMNGKSVKTKSSDLTNVNEQDISKMDPDKVRKLLLKLF